MRAANVGGVMRAEGRSPFQRAVAHAYNSRIGLGGGAYHSGGADGPAESAYLGVMRRAVLDEVGGFDETIRRGEDWELNLRIRRAGYRVWFDPDLAVAYWPRERWSRLVRQFRSTGTWRGELVRRYGRRNSLRFFAPPALLVVAALALVVAIAAVLISVILSATTGFAAAEGAMRHAIGLSPEGLENLSEDQLLALLSPVRGLVLWAEIGFWLGTALGLVALALGITAIATRRGRGFGVAAVVIAAVGPFLYGITVGAFVIAGIAAGAS